MTTKEKYNKSIIKMNKLMIEIESIYKYLLNYELTNKETFEKLDTINLLYYEFVRTLDELERFRYKMTYEIEEPEGS